MFKDKTNESRQKERKQQSEFEDIVKPVIKWLNDCTDQCCPHTHVVITPTHAQLSQGVRVVHTEEFLKD